MYFKIYQNEFFKNIFVFYFEYSFKNCYLWKPDDSVLLKSKILPHKVNVNLNYKEILSMNIWSRKKAK